MLHLMRRLMLLVPSLANRMRLAAFLKVAETLCMGIPYGIMAYTLNKLLNGTLVTTDIWVATGVMAACFLGQGVFCFCFTRIAYPIGTELCEQVRIMVAGHLRKLPMRYFSHTSAGDTTALVSDDLVLLTLIPRMAFPQFVTALVLPVVIAPFLFAMDWRLALIALLPVPLSLPVLDLCRKALDKGMRKRNGAMVAISSMVIEYVQGMEVVKGFRMIGKRFASFMALLERHKKENLQLVYRFLPLMLGYQAILDGGFVLLLLAGAYLFTTAQTSLFIFLAFLILGLRIYEPLKGLGAVYEITQSAELTIERLEALLAQPVMLTEDAEPPITDVSVHFENVSFAYESKPVLKDVSFSIPAKSVTVFVGPSGAGKTTILRLIARFWDADSGVIRIGETPVTALSNEALFNRITMVFQDVYLFQGTVWENIAFGSNSVDRGAVYAAAKAARCHEFIERLPNGYDTMVGEGGATLSGGEKQRISIARAVLKNAPIILLDEATASVDPDNESQIQSAINQLVATKTVIMVAHRLSTVTTADQIIVLDGKGGIAAAGTHTDLLTGCELYQRLWTSRQQALGWKVNTQQ